MSGMGVARRLEPRLPICLMHLALMYSANTMSMTLDDKWRYSLSVSGCDISSYQQSPSRSQSMAIGAIISARSISQSLLDDIGSKCVHPASTVFESIAPDEPAGGDKEAHIDALIERMKELLGEALYEHVFDQGLKAILDDIKGDLAEFGVRYDE